MAFMDFLPQFSDNTDQSVDDPTLREINLKRKLALANSLRGQAAPQGQMVSGIYVRPSWTQSLAHGVNQYLANSTENEAIKNYGEAQKAEKDKLSKAFNEYITGKGPKDVTTTQDNFVTQPLQEGQSVATSPSYSPTSQSSEQVGQVAPNYAGQAPVLNMTGNTTVNQPISTTTQAPRTKQELMANALKYINASGNTDLASKAVLGDIENMFKAPETNLGKVEPHQYTPQSVAKFKETGNYNDLQAITKNAAPTVRTMRMGTNEVTQQWNDKTQSWDQIAKGPAFKPDDGSSAGYRPKAGSTTGELEYIPGGPADPNKTVPLGNRESVFINRIGIASNETAKDLKNIVRIPLTTSRGVFGGRQQGGSLFDAGKESLTNAMTTQDVQSYNTLASGLQRNLAAIEAAGLAPSGTLTHQMDAVIFKNGDTNYTKLQKLAQIKQIANAGIETTLSNPRLPEKQVKHFEGILNEINQAVPFDNGDLITLQQAHQTNPNVTINDIVKAKQKNAQQSDVRNAADAIVNQTISSTPGGK
jgi:hypothetical protein